MTKEHNAIPGFIELSFSFGVKRLIALDAIRRVDKREGYETAELILEGCPRSLYPNETYSEILDLIRQATAAKGAKEQP